MSDNLSDYIGQRVCLCNSAGAKFQGALKAVNLNGSAILLCDATDVGYGWRRHKAELKVVKKAGIVDCHGDA